MLIRQFLPNPIFINSSWRLVSEFGKLSRKYQIEVGVKAEAIRCQATRSEKCEDSTEFGWSDNPAAWGTLDARPVPTATYPRSNGPKSFSIRHFHLSCQVVFTISMKSFVLSLFDATLAWLGHSLLEHCSFVGPAHVNFQRNTRNMTEICG
mgnify:CR=1 FL=1